MEPTTAEDWMAVASDRAMDAEAIKQKQPNSVGSLSVRNLGEEKETGFLFYFGFLAKVN